MDKFLNYVQALTEFQNETFKDATPKSSLKKMITEVDEIIIELETNIDNRTHRLEEYADVFGCLLGALIKDGFTVPDLITMAIYKLEKNKKREWISQGNGIYQHAPNDWEDQNQIVNMADKSLVLKAIKSMLPEHYECTYDEPLCCIRCKSSIGISDETEEGNQQWQIFFDTVKQYLGEYFKEIYHDTNANHSDFTVYFG